MVYFSERSKRLMTDDLVNDMPLYFLCEFTVSHLQIPHLILQRSEVTQERPDVACP